MLSSTRPVPQLAGAPNFRDLGGYRAADGRCVRHGLLYRSEGLSELTDGDLEIIRSLNVRLICDLRSDHERLRIPSRWPDRTTVSTLHLNVSTDLRAGYDAMARVLLENPSERGATQAMLLSYRQFPSAFAPRLVTLFDTLLKGDGLPMVFHCAAGKDRTGFLAAILLSALGVSRAEVLQDYLQSGRHWHGPRSEASLKQVLNSIFSTAPPLSVMQPLITVREEYLAAAFDVIAAHYSSVDTYLEQAAGLTPQRRDALCHMLLE